MEMIQPDGFAPSCPIPASSYAHVVLAHGGGGRLMHQLIEKIFLAALGGPDPGNRHDGAVLAPPSGRLAFTTDSYVVRPLFFPGGDIGSLAVHGSVNDLAMCGARPLWLSAGFILEEGLAMETLWKVALSMGRAAGAAGVRVVTGDTKVVEHGKGDGIFINTAGIGVVEHDLAISPAAVREGDAVILSGDVGRHGIAVLASREGLGFESEIESDSAPVAAPVLDLIRAGATIHCLRDLTRGGLATSLVEIAEASRVHVRIDESAVPVREDVQGACELLGFDPLYVANEGRFVCFLPAAQAGKALEILRSHPVSAGACEVGRVLEGGDPGRVTLTSRIGATRVIEMLSGEQLPRIC